VKRTIQIAIIALFATIAGLLICFITAFNLLNSSIQAAQATTVAQFSISYRQETQQILEDAGNQVAAIPNNSFSSSEYAACEAMIAGAMKSNQGQYIIYIDNVVIPGSVTSAAASARVSFPDGTEIGMAYYFNSIVRCTLAF
jgi:hypothetical protein